MFLEEDVLSIRRFLLTEDSGGGKPSKLSMQGELENLIGCCFSGDT
jgi:hypothetical protein